MNDFWYSLLGFVTGVGCFALIKPWLNSNSVSQRYLELSEATWQNTITAFPLLKNFGHTWTTACMINLLVGVLLIYIAIHINFYLMSVAFFSPTDLFKSVEASIVKSSLVQVGSIFAAAFVVLPWFVAHRALPTLLSRKWLRSFHQSPDYKTAIEALDKLITLELWMGHTATADKYSLQLLELVDPKVEKLNLLAIDQLPHNYLSKNSDK
ncbi:MAG: hypothetical protein Q8T09_00515 [Candidatus Melainabacteria bacterium]|nr:hypothetical protein [Candidatus Melainabacteria bacterium]